MTADHVLVGNPKNDSDGQKWAVVPSGPGYTICNLRTKMYLSLAEIKQGGPVVATHFPAAWDILELSVGDPKFTVYEFFWPLTPFMLDLEGGSTAPRTRVQIFTEVGVPPEHRKFRQWKAISVDGDLGGVADNGLTVTKTTTTTTTTVQRVARGALLTDIPECHSCVMRSQ
ncbi:carbohydrate-binding module family 13 protein [Hydnomerulius pinastri MD-312]|uniref:Carbohydrate-binding module family 13 protein n=1 Tax=Hydnomerulius pinastri MD-312 TaxID=994086 RepID=A0A0C9WBF2_9AGAM|nr:carbohydrate-binding module family 13 protein [Hydnomerulius pinastri MD-312]